MPRQHVPRKYDPLSDYLAQASGERVTLTLDEIEAIIGASLPPTASSSQFWGNYLHAWPAPVWRRVGWRVAPFAPRSPVQAVTFVRASVDTAA